jgi:hypothetical protein
MKILPFVSIASALASNILAQAQSQWPIHNNGLNKVVEWLVAITHW